MSDRIEEAYTLFDIRLFRVYWFTVKWNVCERDQGSAGAGLVTQVDADPTSSRWRAAARAVRVACLSYRQAGNLFLRAARICCSPPSRRSLGTT